MKIDRKKIPSIIVSVIFVGFIAFFSLGTLISKDRDFSEMENRTLTQKPELTKDKLFSGEYGEDVEKYMSDQIFLKDSLMTFKTTCDYFSGKTYQNGVYFGADGYLLQRYDEDTANIDSNVAAINEFAEKSAASGISVDFILVPNSICINSDRLPQGAVSDDQLESICHIKQTLSPSVNLYDPTPILKGLKDEHIQAYYRSDHHWTSSAARAVADGWLESKGMTGTQGLEYNTVGDFYGSLYSKAPADFLRPDKFGYYSDPSLTMTVNYVAENRTTASVMDESYFTKKDKYASFFGGNFSHLIIKSNAPTEEKLLVVKDSYANAFLPLLAEKYSEIHVIDLRYNHTETVSEILKENSISNVLMLYNVDFINSDRNFVWLA